MGKLNGGKECGGCIGAVCFLSSGFEKRNGDLVDFPQSDPSPRATW